MTHVPPAPETDDAAVPETFITNHKKTITHPRISTLLLLVTCQASRRRLTLHVVPTPTTLDPWAKLLHYYPVMTIIKSTHIRTEMWLELQLKSAVLAE